MRKNSKKANRLIIGTLGVATLIAGAFILSSGSGEFFKGQFYYNQDSSEVQEAAKKIDTTMPANVKTSLVLSTSKNAPAKIMFKKNEKEHLIAVFEVKPSAGDRKIATNRIVANIAGNDVAVVKDGKVSIKAFYAYNPHCENLLNPNTCEEAPEPEAVFLPMNTIKNPKSKNDLLVEFKAINDWEIDQADWRHETYGNIYYLGVYSEIDPAKNEKVKTVITSIKYFGNDKKLVGIEGIPTEYEIINVY